MATFLERFVITVLAAVFSALTFMTKFDLSVTQRIGLIGIVLGLALFLGATIERMKGPKAAPAVANEPQAPSASPPTRPIAAPPTPPVNEPSAAEPDFQHKATTRKRRPMVKKIGDVINQTNNDVAIGKVGTLNVYNRPPQRHLQDVMSWLNAHVQSGDRVMVSWSMGDMEAQRLASEIIAFLPSMGVQVTMTSPGAGLEELRGMQMGGGGRGTKAILVCSQE